jgi:hypothetical protein
MTLVNALNSKTIVNLKKYYAPATPAPARVPTQETPPAAPAQ